MPQRQLDSSHDLIRSCLYAIAHSQIGADGIVLANWQRLAARAPMTVLSRSWAYDGVLDVFATAQRQVATRGINCTAD